MSTRPLDATRLLPLRRRLSRRSLLTASARAGVGAAGLALVGCSDDADQAQALAQQDEPPEPPQAQSAQAASQQAQPAQQAQQVQQGQQSEDSQPDGQSAQAEAASGPQSGGVIRLWLATERHDRWDPHRSRFRYTRAMHSLMYNRLIRPASVASGELEADLASLPEMPDETTYVFRIDPAAVFWDSEPTRGRAVTAEDARWNIQRQRDALDAGGLPDPHFFRRSVYDRTASAEATSDETLTLTTPRPDATYLASVHGSPFAWITSPEAAELHGDAWRDDPSDVFLNSGTGPYTPLLYNGFELTLARSGNWWRADSAYADGVTFTSGDPNNIVSLYDAAAFDAAGFPLTNETVESLREQYPEHPGFERPLDAGVELLAPLSADPESPLSDPRVLRAAAIAIDRPALVERLYAGHGRPSGPAPWFLDGWSLSDSLLSGFPAYRGDREADLAEIGQLVSAAGGAGAVGALTLVVADLFEGFFAGSGEAVRSMIAEATGLEVERELRPFAEAIDRLRGGERFLFLGWGAAPQQADPTDQWADSLHSAGVRHWSDDADAEIDGLIEQMQTTFNRAARQDLAHQLQERLLGGDAHQWQVKLVNGVQLGIHQPWFQPDPRLFEYAWSTERVATSWLDTGHASYPSGRELPEPEAEADAGG